MSETNELTNQTSAKRNVAMMLAANASSKEQQNS